MDFNKLNTLCQIIESGNYQSASEVLHVTPSALSQTVASLERSFGFSLFDRRGRRLIPTPAGRRLHQEFRRHQTGVLRAVAEIQNDRQRVAGTLRIGAYLEFAKSRLSPLIMKFISDFPEAKVKMTFDSPSRLQHLLSEGQLDLCFSIFPARENKKIRSTRFIKEELVLIASRRLISSPQPSLDDLLSVPIVDYFINHQPIRRWLHLHYGKNLKKIPVRVFASTAEMVVALVKEGSGVGVVPKYVIENLNDLELQIVRPTPRKLEDYIWLLEPVEVPRSAVFDMFRDRLA